MEDRRLSAAEKGKSVVSEPYQAPRKARVRVPEPENHFLLQKHSLTLIGRVTNPSTQKIWSLLPFFAEKWATETRPIGSDLGQGMFQFQFEKEEDLLTVLAKRPYQYARWMVIVERWNPTMAPDFPSLIPFWIKVQGIHVHLWTETTIKTIGEDIGIYEEAEITSLSARMRVQINGRLPLITSTIVEFPRGEVTATLVYEQIGKHCSYCYRLDHEPRDCLKAKAEKRAALAIEENDKEEFSYRSREHTSKERRGDPPYGKAPPAHQRYTSRASPYSRPNAYEGNRQQPNNNRSESRSYREDYARRSEDRNYQQRKAREHHSLDRERSSHTSAFREDHRQPPPAARYPSRERGLPISREEKEDSNASKRATHNVEKGIPLQTTGENLPREALDEARGEVHEFMRQYSSVADPTESAVRKERYRLSEELGEIEETAAQMVRARLESQELPFQADVTKETPQRVPALLRLGPSLPPTQEPPNPTSQTGTRRKPGRPPGAKKKVHSSPKNLVGTSSKLRKVQQTKPPTCRRNLTKQKNPRTSKGTTSRESSDKQESAQDSENQPICNMIPATTKKKKAGFRTPSTLVP